MAVYAPRAAPPQPTAAEVELVLGFARAGHEAGYPTADLEERVLALARSLGLRDAQVSATPTLVEVVLGAVREQSSYTLRVRPPRVDLDAIAQLDDFMEEALEARPEPVAALARLAELREHPLTRPPALLLAAYAVAGAALTPVLGGGVPEALGAAGIGLAVGALSLLGNRTTRTEPMVAPLAAVAASFGAAVIVRLGLDASADVVTLAALVTFLPGMTLTIGIRELATEHLQSGVANTASALAQLLGLVFGVGVGGSVAAYWFGPTPEVAPHIGFGSVQLLAAVAAGLAFTLTLRARFRAAPVMCAATVLALLVNAGATELFGEQAAAFCAALAVGVVGGLLGTYARRSSLVFIVPGVLMLVPGSAGFNSVLQLLSDQTVSGVTAAVDTFVTAMSIAYGLMVSAVVMPRRPLEVTP